MNVDELRTALTEIAGDRPEAAPAYEGVRQRVRRARHRRAGTGVTVVAILVLASYVGIRALGNGDSLPRVATSIPTTSITVAPTTTVAVPEGVHGALDAWKAFPVDASPRPLIMFEPVNAPDGGFPNDDTKFAWESGQFTVSTALPVLPTTSGGYPLVSGQAAIDRIAAEATPGPTATKPLTVTAVTLGSAQFSTDRGMQQLPAWLVTFAGIANPAQVLAVAPAALFTPPAPTTDRPGSVGAITRVDERTLEVGVVGAERGDGPCQARYEIQVYESDHAVAFVAHELPKPPPTTTPTSAVVVCAGVAYVQKMRVTIDRPLGNRVAIDGATRVPLAVSPANG